MVCMKMLAALTTGLLQLMLLLKEQLHVLCSSQYFIQSFHYNIMDSLGWIACDIIFQIHFK